MKAKVKTKKSSALVAFMLCLPLLCGIVLGVNRATSAHAAESYTVDTTNIKQEFDGWGTSLIWWAGQVGGYDWKAAGSDKEVREEIMELIYGADGLEYNIARYNIGGGENPYCNWGDSHLQLGRKMQGWTVEDSLPMTEEEKQVVTTGDVPDEACDHTVTSESSENKVDKTTGIVTQVKTTKWRYAPSDGQTAPDASEHTMVTHTPVDKLVTTWKGEETANWNADANQRWILEWIYENAGEKDNLITEFFSNSPPWYMTNTQCVSGGKTTNPKNAPPNFYNKSTEIPNEDDQKLIDEYAKYFVDVLYHLVAVEGYEFDYVNPFNESNTRWWPAGGSQEGCDFTNAGRAAVLRAVVAELDKHPELADVQIAFDDSAGVNKLKESYNYLKGKRNANGNEVIYDRLGKLNYHLYAGDSADDIKQISEWAKEETKTLNKPVKAWMSEMGYNESDGTKPTPMATAFKHSEMIRRNINNGAQAYVLWQIVEELSSQLGTTSNYGPIKVSYQSAEAVPNLKNYGYDLGSYTVNKQYYILGQYSKYIKAGYNIISTSDGSGIAAISPDKKKVVIVHENNSEKSQDVSYAFDGSYITNAQVIYTDKTHDWARSSLAASGDKFSYTITPSSVTTFVLDVVTYKEPVRYEDFGITASSNQWVKLSAATLPTVADFIGNTYDSNKLYLTSGWAGYDGTSQWVAGGTGVGIMFKFTGGQRVEFEFKYKAANADDAGDVRFSLYDSEGTQLEQSQNLKAVGVAGSYNVLWTKGGLDREKTYAVKIEVLNGWTNFNKARVYQTDRVENMTMPSLEAATVIDGKLYVDLGSSTGTYTLYYREEGMRTASSKTITAADTSEAVVTGLTGGSYDVWMEDSEGLVSVTHTVHNAVRDQKLLYYVNAGANNPHDYSVYERAGKFNTSKDQPYGLDAQTGKSWGVTTSAKDKYQLGADINSPYYAIGEVLEGAADGTITYRFEVGEAQETYDILLTSYNTWSTRSAAVSVNSTKVGDFIMQAKVENFAYIPDVSAQNGEIVLTVAKSEGEGESPLIGTIMIAAHSDKAAAYATAAVLEDATSSAVTNGVTGVKLFRLARVEAKYDESLDLSGAYIYYTDGTSEKVTGNEVKLDSLEITNNTPNAESGILTGSVRGLRFRNTVTLTSNKASVYYYVDCGTNGSNPAAVGSLQSPGEYDKQASGGSWGFNGDATDMSGDYQVKIGSTRIAQAGWRGDNYIGSILYEITDRFYYTFTGLPTGAQLAVEVGAKDPNNWGARAFEVWFGTANTAYNGTGNEKLGTVVIGGNGQTGTVTAKTSAAVTSSTLYMFFHPVALTAEESPTGKAIGKQNAIVSYIKILSAYDDAPAAPKVDKAEAYRDSVLKVSEVAAGDLIVLTGDNGRLIGSVKATAPQASAAQGNTPVLVETLVDLSQYDLTGCQAIMVGVRHDGCIEESDRTMVALPQMLVTNIREEWAERNVLHLSPSMGVTVQSVIVYAPSGRKSDVTEHEYFHYVTKENGEYTIELTTKTNSKYTQKVNVDNLDNIVISSDYDPAWTNNDVTVNLTVSYSPSKYVTHGSVILADAIAEVYIDDEPCEISGTYSFNATENTSHTLRFVLSTGRVIEHTVDIANIDKSMAIYTVTPDFTNADGFAASLVSGNISGGTFTVTKGEETYASVNGLRLVEAGEYSVRYISGVGREASFGINLTYDPASLKSIAVTKEGNSLQVANGTARVYQMGTGKELTAGSNGYELASGYRYMVLAETAEGYEALILTEEGTPQEPQKSGGCRSAASASGMLLAMLALSAAASLILIRKGTKGGIKA